MDLAELRRDEKEPLSDGDIQQLVGPTCVMTYPQLQQCQRIEDCLDPKGRIFLLFLTESATSGHWILVHTPREGVLEVFDSYGGKPDSWFSWLSDEEEAQLHQQRHELTRLLKDAAARGWEITYNPVQLQSKKGDIATCGRHAVVRAMLHDWPLSNYVALLQTGGDPDLFVTAVTEAMEDSLGS